ncbi:probable serine/threonine-protein kinase nek3 [Microplitis mediator]|uniref:probable serine/threonine-protein kinase nek3 n=1 Tax=Microplitis mediator TaxID=375433 RepID=UPI002556BA91|nr:probable serine/threonine-protein kinase nek3 [Microplitis mediator]
MMKKELLAVKFFLFFTIVNCVSFETPRLNGSGKNSRRNHKYSHLNGEEAVVAAAAAVAVAATADYHPDYLPQESVHPTNNNNNKNNENENEYRGGKLIGKWRSTGEAIEPKWRDGDSIPLVPFEEAATRRKIPKTRDKVATSFTINYPDNLPESVPKKSPIPEPYSTGFSNSPAYQDSNFPINNNGHVNSQVIYKNPLIIKNSQGSIPVSIPVPVPLNHEPITNKLHELHLAKLRYLSIPLSNINLPIPEIIPSSEITPHNYFYTTDENNNNTNGLRIVNRRYRTRKPKPVTKIPEEDSHTGYAEETIKTSLSTTPITTPSSTSTTSTTTSSTAPIPTTTTTTTTSTTTPTPTTITPTTSAITSTDPSTASTTNAHVTEKTKQVTKVRQSTRTTDKVNPFENKNEYELNDEESQRPRPRKRRPPSNYEFELEDKSSPGNSELRSKERPVVSQRRNRTRNNQTEVNKLENTELKSLLKMQQVEGTSLSEILQRRNLSLSDLLKRKSEVINVLKNKDGDDLDNSGSIDNITSIFNYDINNNSSSSKNTSDNNDNNDNSNDKIKNSIKEANERRWRRPFRRNKLRVPSRRTTTSRAPVSKESTREETNPENIEVDKKKSTEEPNERKYNEKLSTISKLSPSVIFPRLNSFTKKPVTLIPTSTSTTAKPATTKNQTSVIKEATDERTANEGRLKPAQSDEDEIMEFSDFSTVSTDVDQDEADGDKTERSDFPVTERSDTNYYFNGGNTIFSRYEDLTKDIGSTLSIEHILTTQPPTKPTKADPSYPIDEKSNNLFSESEDYQNDGLKHEQEVDEENFGGTTLGYEGTDDLDYDSTPSTSNFSKDKNRNNEIYERIVSEMEPEVRAEIFELISTGSSAKRLEEILRSRNMSIDELIALRQRGSSRVHLAELSRLRSKSGSETSDDDPVTEPVTSTEPSRNDDDTDDADDDLKKEPIIIDLFGNKGFEAGIINEEKNETGSKKNVLKLDDLLSAFDSLPFLRNYTIDDEIIEKVSTVTSTSTTESFKYEIKNIFDEFRAGQVGFPGDKAAGGDATGINAQEMKIIRDELGINDKRTGKNIKIDASSKENESMEREMGTVEEIVSKFESLDTTEEINPTVPEVKPVEINLAGEVERKNLSRVRPSIIASGAILGMTIVGFLVIFIVCRIKQKQRYRYKNSFAKTVFQTPAMSGRKLSNSSSLNTIMVNVVATSTAKRAVQRETQQVEEHFDCSKSDIDNDSLDANDSWETIPDFMK